MVRREILRRLFIVHETPFVFKIYEQTGEYSATLDFGKKEVDWNKVHQSLRSNCQCIWAESDLESYVTVFGKEKDCIQAVVDYLK